MPLYDTLYPLFPYSVAISFPCRNNFDKNQAIFLESAQNPRTFAAVKDHTLVVFSYIYFGYLVKKEKGSQRRAFFLLIPCNFCIVAVIQA